MKATNLEMELIRRAVNKKDLPKGCRTKIFYIDNDFDITFSIGRHSHVTFYSEDGKLTYRVFVFDFPKTDFMSVKEVRDIDFAFGQLVHFKEEVEG